MFGESSVAPDAKLPRPGSPIFGRDEDIVALTLHLADPEVRLITVTGPGGVGKTRLSIETADRSKGLFADGVWYVSLAPVRDESQVLPAIAHALGIQVSVNSRALDQLILNLRHQQVLLVIDNFEQVLGAAAEIGRLLKNCSAVKTLVTSRSALGIDHEHLFPVAPLQVGPVSDRELQWPELLPGAIQLFAERGRRADLDFSLNQGNAETVVEICQRLDGLPLAVELAAARLSVVTVTALLERLDPALVLLAGRDRHQPDRHQTMRAAIEWSYQLLTTEDQQLFRWVSVFVGGFRLPAVDGLIAKLSDSTGVAGPTAGEVVNSLAGLMESSLVQRSKGPGSDDRYLMLEVVREFGLELLDRQGELSAARDAHAAWYAASQYWLEPNHIARGERLIDHVWNIDAEHPNLRTALAYCESTGKFESLLQIAASLAVFWHQRGLLGEGREWLERALQLSPNSPLEMRGWALAGLGLLRWSQSDQTAESPLYEAVAIAEQIESIDLQVLVIHILGLVELERGESERARERFEVAHALNKELGNVSGEAMTLHILTLLPLQPGQPDDRLDQEYRCLEMFRSIGHEGGAGYSLLNLGRLLIQSGDERRGLDYLIDSMLAFMAADERWVVARNLGWIAELAVRHGHLRVAARLIGAIDARLTLADASLPPTFQDCYDQVEAVLLRKLGPKGFDGERKAGSRLTGNQILVLLASLKKQIFGRPLLTDRELEVLYLVAAGFTDLQIAEALFVGRRTIHTHVGHILVKLEMPTRHQAVQRAYELGLLEAPA